MGAPDQFAYHSIPNSLTPQQCDRLLEHVLANTTKSKAGIYNKSAPEEHFVDSERKGHTWGSHSMNNRVLSEGLPHHAITQAYAAWADKFKSYCSPPQVTPGAYEVQLAVYDESGDHFRRHYDQRMGTAELYANHPLRKMSMSIILSNPDEYEGGGLRFFDQRGSTIRVSQNKGDIFIFPAWQEHQVDPVTSGKRNALVLWMLGDIWV